ncbi:MAG: hypothetical protein R3F61_21140 [Myxococcota bacterium]
MSRTRALAVLAALSAGCVPEDPDDTRSFEVGPLDLHFDATLLGSPVQGCALRPDGTAFCFGEGSPLRGLDAPALIHAELTDVLDLSFDCVLGTDGTARCGAETFTPEALGTPIRRVGSPRALALADGSLAWNPQALATDVLYRWSRAGDPVVDVFDGQGPCALLESGDLWCARDYDGDGYGGFDRPPEQRARNVRTVGTDGRCWVTHDDVWDCMPFSNAPHDLDGTGIVAVAGFQPTCGLHESGTVRCAQNGDGSVVEITFPKPAVGLASRYDSQICTVLEDREVWCWIGYGGDPITRWHPSP